MKKLLLFILLFGFPIQAQALEICKTVSETLEISALYPAPIDDEDEWIELKNTGTVEIDLAYFTIEDATAKPMKLSGILAANDTGKIDGLSFQLNNGDDSITLKNTDGTVIDTWTYENTGKGEVVYRNQSANTEVELEVELTEETSATGEAATSSIWPEFSEALPNPEGSDSTEEWIELYNPYDSAIELTGFKLDDVDGGSSPYSLNETIAAKGYLIISVEDSKISLNNSVDSIRLLNSDGTVLWGVSYEGPKEGYSYALFENDYVWTSTPTPGSENEYSNSSDETESQYENGDLSEEVEISEVYPNPEGADAEEEWVEITNGGEAAVNLGNWTLDDGEGGSDPYVFPDDTIIEPGETLVIYRKESGVALNNSDEIVKLNDYTGETVDEIGYESSVEGESYARIEVEEMESAMASTAGLGTRVFEKWQWSSPSPGVKNPKWQQFKGEVLGYENGMLSIFDGVSTWDFEANENALDGFLFQTGNLVLVQAFLNGDSLKITYSELLQSAVSAESKSFPFGLIGSGLLAAAWIGYEAYKKRKQNMTYKMQY